MGTQCKDYVVYDKNTDSYDWDDINDAINYNWTPSELGNNSARTLLSEWDLSDSDNVFEDTGVFLLLDNMVSEHGTANINWNSGDGVLGTAPQEYPVGFNTIYQSITLGEELANGNYYLESDDSLSGITRSNLLGNAYRFRAKVKKVSGGTLQFRYYMGLWTYVNLNALDEWTIIDLYINPLNTSFIFSGTTGGDAYEFEYIKLEEINVGNNFIQPTAAYQPLLTNGGTKDAVATFDGVDDYLSQPVTSANFQDLTRFEWWGVVYLDSTSTPYDFIVNDDGNDDDRVLFQGRPNNKFRILSNNGSATINAVDTVNTFSDGYHVVGFICTGSTYKIYVDGIEEAVTAVEGSNTGEFVGGMTNKANYDMSTIGVLRGSSSVFGVTKERHSLCFGGTTDAALSTEAERTNIFNYLNKANDLGL